jgi:hypothetical protein
MAGGWPQDFDVLLQDLKESRCRPAFIDMAPTPAPQLIERLESQVASKVSIGSFFAQFVDSSELSGVLAKISGHSTLLIDLEVLFSPELRLDTVAQLRNIAQKTALIVAWPGRITGDRLIYGTPGRADYLEAPIQQAIVLRPIETYFPDDVPYTVEYHRA